jgi:hypothetical protein
VPIHKDSRHEADIAAPPPINPLGVVVAHAVSLDHAEEPIEVIDQQWIAERGWRGVSKRIDFERQEKWDQQPESGLEYRGTIWDWTGNARPPRRGVSGAAQGSSADGGTNQYATRLEEATPRPEVGVVMVVS